jgi:4-hydroxymandelate oxidase
MMALAHPDKEIGIAKAAKKAGTIMTTSTMSTTSIEELSQTEANIWFQLYVHKDRGLTNNLVERAEAANCKALVVTVDLPVVGYREFLLRNPLNLPEGIVLANLKDYWNPDEFPSINQYVGSQFDPSLTWADLEQFASSTDLPVLAKGILHADDAKRAVDSGVAGIIVSNHGGRQLDTTPATIDVLARIVEAVDGACDVLVDGGVRRGTDVIKALALGAKAVLIGRPIVWGLSVNGQIGVEQVLEIIRREYDIAMALCGVTSSQNVLADLIFRG